VFERAPHFLRVCKRDGDIFLIGLGLERKLDPASRKRGNQMLEPKLAKPRKIDFAQSYPERSILDLCKVEQTPQGVVESLRVLKRHLYELAFAEIAGLSIGFAGIDDPQRV